MEIDQEIFNMMLAKSMHQIVRIEFRNSKFPYARGPAPSTPARGLCPLDPRQGASPLEPPSLVNNLGPPPFQRLDPPLLVPIYFCLPKVFLKTCSVGLTKKDYVAFSFKKKTKQNKTKQKQSKTLQISSLLTKIWAVIWDKFWLLLVKKICRETIRKNFADPTWRFVYQ